MENQNNQNTKVNVTTGKKSLEIKLSTENLFCMFHELMEHFKPALQYIEENGGWENDIGIHSIEDAMNSGTLPKEVAETVTDFLVFMGAYTVGSKYIKEAKIVPSDSE